MFDFRRLIDLKTQCRGITEQEGHRIKRKMEQFFPVKRFASCNEEFLGYAEGDFSRKLMRLAFPKNCSQIQLVILSITSLLSLHHLRLLQLHLLLPTSPTSFTSTSSTSSTSHTSPASYTPTSSTSCTSFASFIQKFLHSSCYAGLVTYTGVVAQQFLDRSCHTGVVTHEVIFR